MKRNQVYVDFGQCRKFWRCGLIAVCLSSLVQHFNSAYIQINV